MYPYIPLTKEQEQDMLEAIGAKSAPSLFDKIPEGIRLSESLNLPESKSELEVSSILNQLSEKNLSKGMPIFLGAGAYDHYIPSVIKHITGRSEFYTSYTPYQPEVSQGTLQYVFEYQTMIADLTGMAISNASLYDGGSAVSEGALMVSATNKKKVILVSETVNPSSRMVLNTFAHAQGLEVRTLPHCDGVTDPKALEQSLGSDVGCVVLQNPNFYGYIEDVEALTAIAHSIKKCSVVLSVDPISLGVLKAPGAMGVDVVVGEGQGLGIPLNYGGPYLGFMAVNKPFMRKLPGRIVGQTVDRDGKRSWVLTLAAREQHIRREKATSNICSNQGLNVLAATVYMAVMGREGLREVAVQSMQKAHYLHDALIDTGLFVDVARQPYFKEFALKTTIPLQDLNKALYDHGIIGGLDLSTIDKTVENTVLLAVTEKRTVEEMDRFVKIVEGLK